MPGSLPLGKGLCYSSFSLFLGVRHSRLSVPLVPIYYLPVTRISRILDGFKTLQKYGGLARPFLPTSFRLRLPRSSRFSKAGDSHCMGLWDLPLFGIPFAETAMWANHYPASFKTRTKTKTKIVQFQQPESHFSQKRREVGHPQSWWCQNPRAQRVAGPPIR